MSSPFELASAIEQVAPGLYRAEIPAGWSTGRGAFGGLVLGLLARALVAAEPDPDRSLRTLLGDICGPVQPGETWLKTRLLRRGNSQSNLLVELEQQGQVLAVGTAVVGLGRKVAVPHFPIETPPEPPPWRALEVAPVGPPLGPDFGMHLEYRPFRGHPFSGAPVPDVAGFVRLREHGPLDAPALIALLDAHWPGVLAMASGPMATATVSFAGQIFCEPGAVDLDEPLLYRSRIAARHAGYFLELRELWQRGECVAMNQQTLAMIR